MNEQIAEAQVAKLMRIWELESVDEWGFFDDHFYLRTQIDSQTLLDINPLIEFNSCHLLASSATPPLYASKVKAHRAHIGAVEAGDIYMQIYPAEEVDPGHRAEFAEKWWPLLRRNCWLMGYSIEATHEEKAQWSQSFQEVPEVAPSQIVADKLRSERWRVAAAFGVEQWDTQNKNWEGLDLSGRRNEIYVSCLIDGRLDIRELMVESANNRNRGFDKAPSCRVLFDRCDGWYFDPCVAHYNEVMSHALYRLGFEREAFSPKLKAPPLTEAQKLELRQSLPREFWPKRWLAE